MVAANIDVAVIRVTAEPVTTSSQFLVEIVNRGRNGRAPELRRVQPNISLAWIANQVPIEQDADRERYLEGFRRAGLG